MVGNGEAAVVWLGFGDSSLLVCRAKHSSARLRHCLHCLNDAGHGSASVEDVVDDKYVPTSDCRHVAWGDRAGTLRSCIAAGAGKMQLQVRMVDLHSRVSDKTEGPTQERYEQILAGIGLGCSRPIWAIRV